MSGHPQSQRRLLIRNRLSGLLLRGERRGQGRLAFESRADGQQWIERQLRPQDFEIVEEPDERD